MLKAFYYFDNDMTNRSDVNEQLIEKLSFSLNSDSVWIYVESNGTVLQRIIN